MCKCGGKRVLQSILSITLLVISKFALAQTQRSEIQKTNDGGVFTRYISYEIRVEISVTDRKGNDIYGLESKNFRVYENGIEQIVEACSAIPYLEKHSPRIKYRIYYAQANDRPDGTLRKIKVMVKPPTTKRIKINYTPSSYVATRS
jgi:hypothetical protein